MSPPTIEDVSWHDRPAGVDARGELAAACLARDGGLPQSVQADFIWQSQQNLRSVTGIHAVLNGSLVAHSLTGLRGSHQSPERVIEGQVHPALRGRGIGAFLMDWARASCENSIIRTESLEPAAERLYQRMGYRQEFAERIMRRSLAGSCAPPEMPEGIVVKEWKTSTHSAFYRAYSEAFKDRPGFPGWTDSEWIEWISGAEGFRPDASFVALACGEPVGFIASAGNWIEQVGVIPARRGEGLGAALILRAASRLKGLGESECWLNVNVDNAALNLYRRLGFEVHGTRARYKRNEQGAPP